MTSSGAFLLRNDFAHSFFSCADKVAVVARTMSRKKTRINSGCVIKTENKK